jgi:hypothetical protein
LKAAIKRDYSDYERGRAAGRHGGNILRTKERNDDNDVIKDSNGRPRYTYKYRVRWDLFSSDLETAIALSKQNVVAHNAISKYYLTFLFLPNRFVLLKCCMIA